MTSHWLDHLALVSAGLLVAAVAAVPARIALRRDPSACYRLALWLLLGGLALLPVQFVVQGVAHELARPVRTRLSPWLDGTQPAAARIVAELPLVRLEGLAAAADLPAPPAASNDTDSRFTATLSVAAAWLRGSGGLSLWLLGAAIVAGRSLLGLVGTARLVRRARPVEDPRLAALWTSVAAGSRVGARTRLLQTQDVTSPACFGGLRPALLLPQAPGPATAHDALAWAMRHELVHLERGDWAVAALQSAVTALLWFHPAAWWFSFEIRRLRELSCDQVVVEGFGHRRSYALALLEYAAFQSGNSTAIDAGPHSAGARCALLHWSRSLSQIERRIEMLTTESVPVSRPRRTLGRLLALSAFVVPALGQVGAAATLFPRNGADASQEAAVAPRPAAVATPQPTAVAAPACDGDGSCCDDKAKVKVKARSKAAGKKEIAHAEKDSARAAVATLRAQLDESRARADQVRADGRDRAVALRAKLKAAEDAEDEDACAAIEATLERCEAECERAGEECEARCEALDDAVAAALDGIGYAVPDPDDRDLQHQVAEALRQFAAAQRQLAAVNQDDLRRLLAEQQETIARSQEDVRKALESVGRSRVLDDETREKTTRVERARRTKLRPPIPAPAEPELAPEPPDWPVAPEPANLPHRAPPHRLDERAILQRIEALEAEIAELRAALQESRARATPPPAARTRRTTR